ncbi:SGNH/GDSL hydrolase family protein [Frigoribacterium sp. VKM Ac-2836]|uniref:SGNH/GDSL hydrolase family protein n=1 Tax=Frigoribacterium sp. VKM Ac-2836 TaxID=2739014 RepID=UPI001567AF53|nr:SGNH/GDSL hydrolase family protein [Frigoribacterium sp. VKM Ac-2836]NRD27267.1 SGNH/GDSL hydrolase family protein [Frigoribacterium sp. VKM Ac-2836]
MHGLALLAAIASIVTLAGCVAGPRVSESTSPPAGSGSSAPASLAPEVTSNVSVTRGATPLKTLFVGDSLTAGLYASAADRGFRPLMVQALEANGPVTEDQGFQVDATTSEVRQVASVGTDQDLAIVQLGTNDVDATPLPTFEADYGETLRAIRESSPGVVFVCAGVWRGADEAAAYDDVVQSECAAQGGAFRPMSDLFEVDSNRGPAGRVAQGGVSDDFHPNDAGYAAIAHRLLGAIAQN